MPKYYLFLLKQTKILLFFFSLEGNKNIVVIHSSKLLVQVEDKDSSCGVNATKISTAFGRKHSEFQLTKELFK